MISQNGIFIVYSAYTIMLQNLYNKVITFIDKGLEKTDAFINWGGDYIEHMAKKIMKLGIKRLLLTASILVFLFAGGIFIWIATFELPRLDNFDERIIAQSTKIYDRTGDVILFDVHGEVTRTVVPLDSINDYAKWATIAIEDSNFYNHGGIEPRAILRAILTNLRTGDLFGGQGGSTITQQVIKNSLLTSDKKVSRKMKEWVLAPRLENILSKDEILEVYLNEVPYGGTVYGIQEASRRFFAKDAADLSLAESAYLAALPQAPTYFSPYGNNMSDLISRKNKVLREMRSNGLISQSEFDEAMAEEVEFQKPENFGIKAPHFVFWIREQLEEKYGAEAVERGGLKVITTLDWKLQEHAEEVVKRYALENSTRFDAENAATVAIDPQTGQVLAMVGSRDYFDEDIDGNFNIATASRQPGSAFKPFVYAEAFNKGYRPETVVFDLQTEFSTTCVDGGSCYSPVNYDGIFRGPMSLRDALAQSVNVPAVKVLYLAGVADSLNLARSMGITTLKNPNQYGLTLVLGGGEVRPLDMAVAYGTFAAEGVRRDVVGILRVEDKKGKILDEYKEEATRVLPEQTARLISSVLSDNAARTPAFGANSRLHFPGVSVAAKTGTTNDYRDAWIVGYTPTISIASWAGNNDNTSMNKSVAGFIVAPMWGEIMQKAIELYPASGFTPPAPIDPNIKPILAGFWRGEATVLIDKTTGEPATHETLPEDRQVVVGGGGGGIHSILHWVNRSNPLGPPPANPYSDGQYALWESAVQRWVAMQGLGDGFNVPDEDSTQGKIFSIINPRDGESFIRTGTVYVAVTLANSSVINGVVYINNQEVGAIDPVAMLFSFVPDEISGIQSSGNTLRVVITDNNGTTHEDSITFSIQ